MSDITDLKVQRELKPKIEDVLPYYLNDNELEHAQSFIAYLRADKMKPGWAGVHSTWNCNYKGKIICYIRLGRKWLGKADNVKWEISPNLIRMSEYENEIIDENMQNYIWDGLAYCHACNNGCSLGAAKTILSKDLTGLCKPKIEEIIPEYLDIRVFDDRKTGTFKGAKMRCNAGKIGELAETLRKHNEQNRGIYSVSF